MSNIVSYLERPDIAPLVMANGLTSVFVAVLSLASSALAKSDRERRFAAWFASHDQAVRGLGTVDFDISEFPWEIDSFTGDRYFVLRTIEAAKAMTGWERLGYRPRVDWIQRCLDHFRTIVGAFDVVHASPENDRINADRWAREPMLCQIHRTYKHAYGCMLCNDK